MTRAVAIDSGYKVLKEGQEGFAKAGEFHVWDVNSSGVITKGSGWKTGQQMMDLGYEEIFTRDFNGDEIIGKDNGDASYSITGTKAAGGVLSVTEDSADPDGNGTLSYSWQSSSDNSSWSVISTSSTYTLTSTEEGKSIKAIVDYTDGEGHAESITTCLLYTSPSPRD